MLSKIDILVIICYLIIVLLIGYFTGKENEDQDDFFLAKRSMPWIPVALSIAATMISANAFIGGPGWAYSEGMKPFMVNIMVPFAILIALSITTPVFYNLGVSSVYEYIDLRLGRRSQILCVIQFFLTNIIQASSMMYIPILLLHTITDISYIILVPVIVGITIIYTLMGGIKAVIWTDAMQMLLVIFSVFIILAIAFDGIGLEFKDTLYMAYSSGKLNMLNFDFNISDTNNFWAATIGGGVLWFQYFCFDQTQVQRVLTSKSLDSSKKSFVLSMVVMNIIYFLMLFIGVILYFYYKGKAFPTSNEVMIHFILNHLPVGIIGIAISVVFAASMSSVDSALNSMSTVFTKDIYEPYIKKDSNEEASLKIVKIITVFIGLIISIVILIGFSGSVRSILDLVGSYISYFVGPGAGIFILAMFTKKSHDKPVAIGFLIGMLTTLLLSSLFKISWLWNTFIGVFTTSVAGYILSIVIKNTNRKNIEKYTVLGMRKIHLSKNGEKSLCPFYFGKYEIFAVVFMILQYGFLFLIEN